MNSSERFVVLDEFLDYLQEELGWEFDRDEFNDRFKLQKYIFFAQKMGLESNYSYNVYVFGAYSPELAQDYYSNQLSQRDFSGNLDENFQSDDFTELIDGRDSRWLEIASTFLLYNERYDHLEQVDRLDRAIQKTMDEKDATETVVRSIVRTLREFDLTT